MAVRGGRWGIRPPLPTVADLEAAVFCAPSQKKTIGPYHSSSDVEAFDKIQTVILHARGDNWTVASHSKFYLKWAGRTDRRGFGASHWEAMLTISSAEQEAKFTSKLTIVALLFLT